MNAHVLSQATQLSDQDLLARVKDFAHQERKATGILIAHLAVLDERRLYLAEGCSSLFTYCTQALHLSEYAAYSRIEAARAARKFPVILERLSEGMVNLTTVGLLVPHLTAENHLVLLDEAQHKNKRQVEELVARLRPQPPVPSTVRRLPTPKSASLVSPTEDEVPGSVGVELTSVPARSPVPVPAVLSSTRRAVVEPLAPGQYRVQFTADSETHAKLRLAQNLLRHRIPDGDVGKIIDLALTTLLKDLTRQKHAATDRPRQAGPSGKRISRGEAGRPGQGAIVGERRRAPARFRRIPSEVKRAVWVRDGGQCAFFAPNGRRCTEQGFLEFHHVMPYAAGGPATVDNIQLRCRAHNGHEAKVYFGPPGSDMGLRDLLFEGGRDDRPRAGPSIGLAARPS